MDEVFRALNDPHRRLLLDRLYGNDGQTLLELSEALPEMTRFGVMNHLRILEGANLVVTRRSGRHKHHYLNPVPIRLIHDRWINKYTLPWVGALAGLKTHLEKGRTGMAEPVHVYQVFIGCKVDDAWRAITDGQITQHYYYGTIVESDWLPGSPLRYLYPDGSVAADGEVIAVDPPHRLEMTFQPHWDPEFERQGPVRMVWDLQAANGSVKLTVQLFDLEPGSRLYEDFTGGISYIVSGLKTLLETGRPLAATA
ncbi:MAG TPA: SRPBCC domain-containing protein [Acidimicrobiia bacterium]|nr:SRPBCC domain-containing protein [Acidimicrobiia bacterium]